MFLMRHGQSVFNELFDRTGRDPQTPDPALTEKGQAQVRRAAQALTKGTFSMIVSSPYRRAIQTASIVAAEHDVPVFLDPLVGERRLYSCDIGSSWSVLKADFPHVKADDMDGSGEWWLPFPETKADLVSRSQAFLSKWADSPRREGLLVVSHWYFIQAVTGEGLDNAGVTTLVR